MLIKQVQVSIIRDTNTIVKNVNSYEVNVLRAIHGDDDRFQVNKSVKIDPVDFNGDYEEEYQRLKRIYFKDWQLFTNVYRDSDELKKAIIESSAKPPKDADNKVE